MIEALPPPSIVPLDHILPDEPLLMMGAGPVPIPQRVAAANSLVINHLGETIDFVSPSAISLNLAFERLLSLTLITSPGLVIYEGMFTFLPFTVKWL